MIRLITCALLISASTAMTGLADATSSPEEPLDPRITPEVLAAFEPAVFDDNGFQLPYRLMSPETVEADEKLPLLLFLHGKGERGMDNQRQLIHGGTVFASPEFRKRHRAFVVAPQCPDGKEPGSESKRPDDPPGAEADRVWCRGLTSEHPAALDPEANSTAQLSATVRLVDQLLQSHPIDPDRVYVAGLSMGGYATWELAARYPERWAAAAPICGSGDPAYAQRMKELPLWVHHGARDNVIPVERSREMVAAVQSAGGKPIYSEYSEAGHDSWTPTLNSRHVWDWLFAQKRD